jgi:hypothetical protein
MFGGKCFGLIGALIAISICTPASATAVDNYRFENNLSDSGANNQPASILAGSPAFSANVPSATVPQTGAPNNASLSFATSDSLALNYAFPFDTLTNATLEFYLKPISVSSEQDLFWTTNAGGDTNRFNIGVSGGGNIFMDYREPNSNLHSLGSSSQTLTAGQWNFIAITKSASTYAIYVNNALGSTVTDSGPNLPTSTGWTINGRANTQGFGGAQFSGLLDEVRLSDQALSPSQFENVPEPASAALLALGAAAILARRNPRRGLRA